MSLANKTHKVYGLMVLSVVAVVITLLGQTFAHTPSTISGMDFITAGGLLWLFKISPFLLLIRGLIQKRHTTSAWLSFLSMLYFIFGVLLVFTPGGNLFGWLLSAASLLMFLASMMYTRWKKQLG